VAILIDFAQTVIALEASVPVREEESQTVIFIWNKFGRRRNATTV